MLQYLNVPRSIGTLAAVQYDTFCLVTACCHSSFVFFSLPTATKIRHFWTQVLGNFQYVLHVIWQTIYLFYTICLPQLWDTSSDEMSLCFISKSHQNDACKMISSSVQVTCHNVSLCVELTGTKAGRVYVLWHTGLK